MNKNNKQSGFYLLSDNADAFTARFALATTAEKTLDIQYYIMHNDASGQYLAYALLSAADRGVHVRILVDDINLSGRDTALKMLSQHENIEIRIFNPLTNRDWFRHIELLINLKRAGRRMHNKAFVADNSSAIIGGRNIGDEYFDARSNLNFVDLDLLTVGSIVSDITHSFNDYWNSDWATPIEDISKQKVARKHLTNIRNKLKDRWRRAKNTNYFRSIQNSEFTRKIIKRQIPFIWADAELFYDRPEKIHHEASEKTTHVGLHVIPYFNHAKHELLIATPYFVPGMAGLKWFRDKKQSGVNISILTNSLAATDVTAVHAGYKKYRKQLLEADIDIYELKTTAQYRQSKVNRLMVGSKNASLHAKYMIVDQQYVFIGSANLDPRSEKLNTEIGIMVKSRELAKQATELFARSTSADNSYRLEIDKTGKKLVWITQETNNIKQYFNEPGASKMRKLAVFLLSLLPFESLL